MRICVYTNTALPLIGGQEYAVDALARWYQRLGHEVVVLAPRPSRPRQLGDRQLEYTMRRHPRFISTRHLVEAYAWWIHQLHRQRPFDLVHAHGVYPTGYVAWLFRQRTKCPLVVTSHGEEMPGICHRWSKPRVARRMLETLAGVDALVAISRFTHDGLAQLCPPARSRIVDIPNGVETRDFARPFHPPARFGLSSQPQEFLLFLGRLHVRKGVDVLLQALARTPPREATELVIAGDGEERRNLEALAEELGITARVRFVGAVAGEEKNQLLRAARCVVLPSRGWEGLPLVVLESFAAGRPVVASDLPGLTELVHHEETGYVVPAESPESLAAALRRVWSDEAMLNRLSHRARQVASRHDWETIARRHLELFERLVSSSRAAA
jgi:glycosyltransferase involved in cell wall biosynthesis